METMIQPKVTGYRQLNEAEARRSKKWGIPVDDESIARFVARQPKTCPVCGCQVFDPFGMTVVIHDVAKCAAHNA